MKALIIGGARSGYGVARLLRRMQYEVYLVSRDDFEKRFELENRGVIVSLNDQDTDAYDDVDLVVKNPGIPNSHPLVSRFDHVINEIEIATQFHTNGHYYAISGTNGKTTTTTLLYEMLLRKDESAVLAGNVGISLSEKVDEIGNANVDVALEISAFQIEGTPNFKPDVYALLNLTPDHLDRFDSEYDYYQAKLALIPNSKVFIRNIDDQNIVKLTAKTENTLDVSLEQQADITVTDGWAMYKDIKLFDVADLKVVGRHNVFNALVAGTIAYMAGVAIVEIQAVIQNFSGVNHRIEYVDTLNGVQFYNDSKATNPESTEKALKAFDGNIILLAGGYDKHISFDLLQSYNDKIKKAFLFGESKVALSKVFDNYDMVQDMASAFHKALKIAKPGDIVLLSPACASYDQFENFEARGDYFKKMVNDLK